MRSLVSLFACCLLALPLGAADPKEPAKPTAAEDFKAWQGEWKVSATYEPSLSKAGKLPEELALDKTGQSVTIDGNRLMVDGKAVATMANDLNLPAAEAQIGFKSYRLLMLTLPSGRGVLCSYNVGEDAAEITYTHECSCHRGSGHIIALQRVKK